MAYTKINWTTSKPVTPAIANDREDVLNRVNSIWPADSYLDGAGFHNAIYRGKNLGSSLTTAQQTAISSGKFTDLFIGDYWTNSSVTYRIAAFDYYLRCGNTDLTTHHIVAVPDSNMYTHNMNDTRTTDGGYVGSKMYTEGLEQAKTTIKAAFPNHVLKHRIYLTNAVSNGYPSGGAWIDSEVDLMSEPMIYGGFIFAPTRYGGTVPCVEKSQLPLFALRPDFISNRQWFWLRDVVSSGYFAQCGDDGRAYYGNTANVSGVRPAFCIY